MTRAPILMSLLALLTLAGCATTPRARSDAGGVVLTLQVELAGAAPRPLRSGDAVDSGARLVLHAVADAPAYLYVVHYAPAGWSRLLLPASGEELAQPGVPQHRALTLDRQRGEEIFYAIATPRPLAEAEPGLCRQLRLPCQGGGRGDEEKEPPPPPEGVPPDRRGDPVAARALPGAAAVQAGPGGVALLRFVVRH